MYKSLNSLNERIIRCVKCQRLVNFRESVALKKTKRFIKDNYWGKPVIGFGDPNAKIIIVGLAPAAHGGNRTGRVFTGDKSADFLFKCLYQANLANQPYSIHLNDGLILKNVYMTPALKCVPPEDKPKAEELKKCFVYLSEEISYLENAKIILALGKIAFESCVKLFNLKPSLYKFIHGAEYTINNKVKILACYHPSPRNVNTGKINSSQMVKVLNIVNKC